MAVVLFYGVPGAGKTLALHDYLRTHPDHRFFVVDRAGEFDRGAWHWRGQPPAQLYVIGRRPAAELADALPSSGVFVFRGWEAWAVAQLVIDLGDAVFVDDELDFAAQQVDWLRNPLRAICHQGRHQKNARGEVCANHILGACRRPQNLAADLTQVAEQVFIFRMQGDLTLNRLERDSMIEPSERDTIRNLPLLHYKHFPSGNYGHLLPPPR